MIWYLYILKCVDNSLYTGITTDIQRRIKEHEHGKGAKYLRGRSPLKLIYSEELENQTQALKREREIKSWSRQKKLLLIKSYIPVYSF